MWIREPKNERAKELDRANPRFVGQGDIVNSGGGAPSVVEQMRAEAQAKLAAATIGIKECLALLDPLEALCELSATYLFHSEDSFPDTEDAGKWQALIELLAWFVVARTPTPSDKDPAVQEKARLDLHEHLESYHATFALSLFPTERNLASELSLLMKVETALVRGEGHLSQIENLARGIYGPHAEWFRETLGFTIEDAFQIAERLAHRVEHTLNERFESARKSTAEFRARCERSMGGGSKELQDEELAVAISALGLEETVKRHSAALVFRNCKAVLSVTEDDLQAECGSIEPETVHAFLIRMSQAVGGAGGEPSLLGFNPLYKRPLIAESGRYFLVSLPTLQEALLSTFHYDALEDRIYWPVYDVERARWLETETANALRKIFPVVETNLTYGPAGHEYGEIDVLAIWGDAALVIQCKWKSLTLQSRLGDMASLNVDIEKSIAAAFSQAEAGARYLLEGGADPIVFRRKDGSELIVGRRQLADITEVTLLGRGAMATIMANPTRLQPGAKGPGLNRRWALSLIDLWTVCDVFDLTSEFLHYLEWRDAITRDGRFFWHDEWDLLGVYLGPRFSPTDSRFAEVNEVVLSGYDTELDHWVRSRSNQQLPAAQRPSRRIPDRLRDLIRHLESSDLPGRRTVCVAMLRFSDAELATLAEQWASAEERLRRSGGIRSFTALDKASHAGIAVVCSDQPPEDRRRSLAGLCIAKKYETRASEWIGIGFGPGRETPDVVVSMSGPWERKEPLEKLLGQIKTGGRPL